VPDILEKGVWMKLTGIVFLAAIMTANGAFADASGSLRVSGSSVVLGVYAQGTLIIVR
jgi:ABC-type phosphate transport system substrate-binding protein